MNTKKFDMATLDTRAGANAGYDLVILDPAQQDPFGLTVHILGSDSKEYTKISRGMNMKRMERLRKSGGVRNVDIPIEEIERDAISLLTACITGWVADPGLELDGKPFPAYSPAAATALLERFPWFREQIDMGIGNRGNFIKGSPKP